MRVGVLALQGDFREHAALLADLGAEAALVRTPEELAKEEALVLPGGESTAIARLMRLAGLEQPLREFSGPMLGTCAGLILLSRSHLGRLDIEVERNAYGRQPQSFEAEVELDGEELPLRGVFIRAPRVVEWGEEVEVLARLDGWPVLLRQGGVIASSFHPELVSDPRVHRLLLDAVASPAASMGA